MSTKTLLKFFSICINTCIVIAALLFSNMFSNTLLAQDDEFENYSFDDNAPQKLPYFALSFGGNAHFLFMKYDDINKHKFYSINNDKLNFSGPIIGWGFDFFSAMSPLVNNARIGITYNAGSQVKEFNETVSASNEYSIEEVKEITVNYNRKLSISNTGIHFDYAIVPIKSLAILPGIGVKFGNMTLEDYATALPRSWNEDISAIQYVEGAKFEYTYMAVEPQISIEYALTGFFMLRVAGSYVLPFDNPFYSNAWTINGNNPYSGVPSSVKPQGFSASIGLYLGLFNY